MNELERKIWKVREIIASTPLDMKKKQPGVTLYRQTYLDNLVNELNHMIITQAGGCPRAEQRKRIMFFS